jgi:cyclopropane fatty-acyl-phospholipid synthase-like methyltransferase
MYFSELHLAEVEAAAGQLRIQQPLAKLEDGSRALEVNCGKGKASRGQNQRAHVDKFQR